LPKLEYQIGEAARVLGVSIDTIRRWDRAGRIKTTRDNGNRRIVSSAEIERLRGVNAKTEISARNRFRGVVREIRVDGLMAQVDIEVVEPGWIAAVITRESVEELDLRLDMEATAVVKATSVMVHREHPL